MYMHTIICEQNYSFITYKLKADVIYHNTL